MAQSVDVAKELVACAIKSLRRSTDPTIRDKVFLNAHLSQIEARAAYGRRCHRCLLASQRQQLGPLAPASNVDMQEVNSVHQNHRVIINSVS